MDIAVKDKDGITIGVVVNVETFEEGDAFAKEKLKEYNYSEIIEDLNIPDMFKCCLMDDKTINNLLKMYPKV